MAGGGASAVAITALLLASPWGPGDPGGDRPGEGSRATGSNGAGLARPADPAGTLAVRDARTTAPRAPAVPARPPAGGPPMGRIQIPAIGVSAPVVALRLHPDRSLQVPARADRAGWWSGGGALGRTEPTVIAGHVDSRTGPGVFFRLRQLRRGDRIVVELKGRRRSFRVERSSMHLKSAFPTHEVYGATGRPALRLITCDGVFDGHSYAQNLIVYAA